MLLQVTLQEVQERTLLKKSVLLTKKLKQQQSMYESVRDERSKYSKALTEVDAEINRISREFKDMTNMV